MEFQTLVKIIMKHCIDRDTAENIAQDILNFHPCGDCANYGDCSSRFEECEYANKDQAFIEPIENYVIIENKELERYDIIDIRNGELVGYGDIYQARITCDYLNSNNA